MCTLKNSGAETFIVEAVVHTVVCKVDWCSSQELGVVISKGETAYLKVSNGMRYLLFNNTHVDSTGLKFLYCSNQVRSCLLLLWVKGFNGAAVTYLFILLFINSNKNIFMPTKRREGFVELMNL
ncbi:MAG: hypothetical protein RIR12_2453 [Bacteroidota bacterium]